jgi:hypothetical protein
MYFFGFPIHPVMFWNNLDFQGVAHLAHPQSIVWKRTIFCHPSTITVSHTTFWGHAVEARGYKPESRGFDSRRGHWSFLINLILPAAIWLSLWMKWVQGILPGCKGRPTNKADNFTAVSWCLENIGAPTCHNHTHLDGLTHGSLYMLLP